LAGGWLVVVGRVVGRIVPVGWLAYRPGGCRPDSSRVVSLSGCWLVGLSGCWLVGLSVALGVSRVVGRIVPGGWLAYRPGGCRPDSSGWLVGLSAGWLPSG